MNIEEISGKFNWLPTPVVRFLEKRMKKIPSVKRMIDEENEKVMSTLEYTLKPYNNKFDKYPFLPSKGMSRDKILLDIQNISL